MKKNKRKILAIIPARGGSKGIPKKNIKLLNGKPLIAYTIEAAKNSKYVDEVYVSTEDQEIANISENFGAKVVKRPQKLANDTASSESVLLHFAEKVDFDILVFLQCTSPLTKTEDIDGAIKKILTKKYDSILSVCEDHGGFLCGGFTWDAEGNSLNYDYKHRPRRQDKKKTFRENGAIYVMTKKGLLKHKNRLHGNIGLYVMPWRRSFEIDEPEDFEFIERLMKIKSIEKIDLNKVNKIKMVLFDVDGVFTDGSVYVSKNGETMLKFSRIDGKGIELLRQKGYIIGVISSEDSEIAKKRMNKLKIQETHIGIKNKLEVYKKLKTKYAFRDDEICFCGDDIQDIPVLEKAGFSCCPQNSQDEVKGICDFVSEKKGGEGFIRDVCNLLINKELWK